MDTVVSLTKADDCGERIALEFKKARLRTPETREQFTGQSIRRDAHDWASEGLRATSGKGRSELDLLKTEILAAYDRLADGVEPTSGPNGAAVRMVRVDALRTEMKDRGFLEAEERAA